MAKDAPSQTLADYMVIAISPVLIMALVGSLVFFLAEVLYVGQYQDTLLWVLFCFVFATVLIARISMTAGISERAGLYGCVLGLVVWLALQRYVTYPEDLPLGDWGGWINLGLIAVIWWSAHRLTWDCTLIDESVDASGVGLLQEAGLDTNTAPPTETAEEPKKKRKRKGDVSPVASWWQRYLRYRDQRKPHTPGVWVVYFSLAALPLYGLGQSLIPADATERRRHAFWLMTIYVASGLGLLLTTSFLGLRRYLRQRKLEMPAAMAGVWMLLGAALIGSLLILGTFLPRPTAEYALWNLPGRATSDGLDASRWAMRGQKEGKGEGKQLVEKKGEEEAGGSKESKEGKGNPQGDGERRRPSKEGKESQGSGDDSKKAGGEQGKKAADGQQKKDGEAKKSDSEQKDGSAQRPEAPPPPSSLPDIVPSWGASLAAFLKKIILVVFGLLIAFVVVRAILKFLANFTDWARDLLKLLEAFWRGLQQVVPNRQAADEEAEVESRPPRPFASFADPFASGQASRMTAAELVSYTFEALEAWARERDFSRRPGETPLEFAERLSEEFPALEATVRQLAAMYVAVAYGRLTDVPAGGREAMRELWRLLRQVGGRRVPAGV